jgi:hypothetical protein
MLLKILVLHGYKAIKGDNSKNEPDMIVISPAFDWKYVLSIQVKTKEKGEEETKKSVSQTLADSGVLERQFKDYEIFPVLITQKERFDGKAIEVAKNKVTLLKTTVFSELMVKTLENIIQWEGLSTKNRSSFLDNLISPFELKDIFRPKPDPITKKQSIEKLFEN